MSKRTPRKGSVESLVNRIVSESKGRKLTASGAKRLMQNLHKAGYGERSLDIAKIVRRKLGGDDSSLATRHRGRQDPGQKRAAVSPAASQSGVDLAERFASDPRQAQRETAALMKISKGRDAPLSEQEASAARFNPGVKYRSAMMDETSLEELPGGQVRPYRERQMRPGNWNYTNPATNPVTRGPGFNPEAHMAKGETYKGPPEGYRGGTLPVVPYDKVQMQSGRYMGNLPRALRKGQDFEAAIMLSKNTDPSNPFAGGNPNDIVKSLSGDQGRYVFEQLFEYPIEEIQTDPRLRRMAGEQRRAEKGPLGSELRRYDTHDLRRD